MKYNKLPLDKLGITGSFEEHVNRGSRGQDFGWFDYEGEPIYSINDGVVMQKDSNQSCGYYLWIKHEFKDYDLWSRYLHLKEPAIVNVGDKVERGQHIANMGGTFGYATHLHFELWKVPKGWNFNWYDRENYAVRGTDYVFAFDNQKISSSSDNSVIMRVVGTNNQVPKDTSKNQIEVIGDYLRCRSEAGTDQTVLGYIDYGLYDYTETKEVNGYTWYKVASGWIAGVEGDVNIYKKEITPVLDDDKDKKINELQKQIKQLDTELLAQKALVEEQKNQIDQLTKKLDTKLNLKKYEAYSDIYIRMKQGDQIYF